MSKPELLKILHAALHLNGGDYVSQDNLWAMQELVSKESDKCAERGDLTIDLRLDNGFQRQIDGRDFKEWLPADWIEE